MGQTSPTYSADLRGSLTIGSWISCPIVDVRFQGGHLAGEDAPLGRGELEATPRGTGLFEVRGGGGWRLQDAERKGSVEELETPC